MKTTRFLLMAAVFLGFSFTVTSCKDDDDKKTEEQKQQEADMAVDAANEFWNVVSQLTNSDAIGDDYLQQTFEPTIGEADEGNPLVRIVGTNNLATAVKRFNDLTGADINENTQTYEWTSNAVGTLTWHKGSGQDYGTVEVSIKQMPKLQRIVYRDGDQMGTNASFRGRAYYRFGDVVEKNGHYWICVRPAFGKEKKQDSHWVCVDQLDDKNVEKCTKGGKTWYVPKKIGENTEHMQNFAELLYAMFAPLEWYHNIEQNPKLPVFHDFKRDNLPYHSLAFWKNVYRNWQQNDLFKKAMCADENTVRKAVLGDGLHLMCWGYSWWTSMSWNLTLKQYTYNGTNLHTQTCLEKKTNMDGKEAFDLRGEYWKEWEKLDDFFYDENEEIDSSGPHWIIRHATGKDLCSGSYDEKSQLKGCTDVYTYYTIHDNNSDPEITVTMGTGNYGDILGQNGRFYATTVDAINDGTYPLAIVVFRGDDGVGDFSFNPKASGLAMALGNADETVWQSGSDADLTVCQEAQIVKKRGEIFDDPYNSKDREGSNTGLQMTKSHQCKGGATAHPAASICAGYLKDHPVQSANVSGWYLPTFGQMGLVFYNLAKKAATINPDYAKYSMDQLFSSNVAMFAEPIWELLDNMYKNAYVNYAKEEYKWGTPHGQYWTATQAEDSDKAWDVLIERTCMFGEEKKTSKLKVRPMCSFIIK